MFKQPIRLEAFGFWYWFYRKITSQLWVHISPAALRLAVQCRYRRHNVLRRGKSVPVQCLR